MAIGPVASTSQDFYLATLQKYGLGPTASPTRSNAAPQTGVSDAPGPDAYTPSPLVAQALASATATLTNADASLFTATSFTPSPTPSGTSSGFVVAIDMSATLALAAYTNKQNGIPGGRTATQLATAELAASPQPSANGSGAQAISVQSAIQAAQASALASTLNFFA